MTTSETSRFEVVVNPHWARIAGLPDSTILIVEYSENGAVQVIGNIVSSTVQGLSWKVLVRPPWGGCVREVIDSATGECSISSVDGKRCLYFCSRHDHEFFGADIPIPVTCPTGDIVRRVKEAMK